MRPRARGKKLLEEWAAPLKSVEDIYEVEFPSTVTLCFLFSISSYF
jgi:hypothetical protein